MKESSMRRTVLEKLNARQGVLAVKVHGGPYQRAGIPDILVMKDGHAMFVELKQPGNKLTPLQEQFRGKLAGAGVPVVVADSVTGAVDGAVLTLEIMRYDRARALHAADGVSVRPSGRSRAAGKKKGREKAVAR